MAKIIAATKGKSIVKADMWFKLTVKVNEVSRQKDKKERNKEKSRKSAAKKQNGIQSKENKAKNLKDRLAKPANKEPIIEFVKHAVETVGADEFVKAAKAGLPHRKNIVIKSENDVPNFMKTLNDGEFGKLLHTLLTNKDFTTAYEYGFKKQLTKHLDLHGVKAMQAEENYYDLGVYVCEIKMNIAKSQM